MAILSWLISLRGLMVELGRFSPGQMSKRSNLISGVGSRESGVGSRESGVGSRESGVGSRESGVGSRESGDGSRMIWRCK
jgi:hypothetical protein